MDLLSVLAISFLAGASTLLGGFICKLTRVSKRILQLSLAGSTGVLLSVIMLGMLPEAMVLGGIGYTALGLVIGGLVFVVAGMLLPHTYLYEKYDDKLYSILKTWSLVTTGIIIYNLPAGLVVGSGFALSATAGLAAFIAVVLQNIPRGVAIQTPMSETGINRNKILLMMLISGVPALIGGTIAFGALYGSMDAILSTGVAFCSGAMLFVFIDQMIPLIKSGRRAHEMALALFIGLLIGLLLLGI